MDRRREKKRGMVRKEIEFNAKKCWVMEIGKSSKRHRTHSVWKKRQSTEVLIYVCLQCENLHHIPQIL